MEIHKSRAVPLRRFPNEISAPTKSIVAARLVVFFLKESGGQTLSFSPTLLRFSGTLTGGHAGRPTGAPL
jgi:hypothetical protein